MDLMIEHYEALQAKLKSLLKKEESSKIRFEENTIRYESEKQTLIKKAKISKNYKLNHCLHS